MYKHSTEHTVSAYTVYESHQQTNECIRRFCFFMLRLLRLLHHARVVILAILLLCACGRMLHWIIKRAPGSAALQHDS